jgi:hypothetical protein
VTATTPCRFSLVCWPQLWHTKVDTEEEEEERCLKDLVAWLTRTGCSISSKTLQERKRMSPTRVRLQIAELRLVFHVSLDLRDTLHVHSRIVARQLAVFVPPPEANSICSCAHCTAQLLSGTQGWVRMQQQDA